MIQRLEGWLAGRPTVLKMRNPWASLEVRATHPRTPISELRDIFFHEPKLRSVIARNIAARLGDDFQSIDFNLFEDEESPFQFMRSCIRYADTDKPRVRAALLELASSNSRVSLYTYRKIEKSGIRPEEFRVLADSHNLMVRRALASNRNTPSNIVADVLSTFDVNDETAILIALEILKTHPQSKRNEILWLMNNRDLSRRLAELLFVDNKAKVELLK